MSGPFGIIRGEDISSYHANPAISSTQLLDLRPCERVFYMKHVAKTLPREESKAFDIGNGAHWLILEGRKALEQRTVVQPATYPAFSTHKVPQFLGEKPWNNNAKYCETWNAQQRGAGLVVLTADELATIERMAAAVGENPDAAALLSGGESEVTFRVQHPAFAVQARADHWHQNGVQLSTGRIAGRVIGDLKTCDTIEQFRRDFFRLRYPYRASFYREVEADAVADASSDLARFFWVASEKKAPWRCEVFEATEEDLELGRIEMLGDLKTLRNCVETNQWEGSKLGIQTIQLAPWQRKMMAEHGAALFETEAA